MTETEAQTKVCHIMPETLAKRSSHEPYCITSKCMAWQKYEPLEFKNQADAEFRKSNRRIYNPHGYCSQGAKPEEIR